MMPALRRGRVAAIALLTVALGALVAPAAQTETSEPAATRVVERSVSFTVQNINRTAIDCASDGGTIRSAGISSARPAPWMTPTPTLYLHGLSYGEFFTPTPSWSPPRPPSATVTRAVTCCPTTPRWTRTANVDEIDVPTFVLIGGQDRIYPVPASEG